MPLFQHGLLNKLLQPRGRANQLRSISRPWLDHARKVQRLTIDNTRKGKKDKVKTESGTYRIAAGVYCLLGSISRPLPSTFLSKLKVDRTEAAVSVTVE